ncbi:MAG TPA: hypothetical protein VKE27_06460 [Candidatus Dormibacteraeota bacterium]|nr:hypothetical protein [Candidatus Dormibacteraeota bacterium]
MRRRLELRDLRSLERRSMYSIFRPLDPDERLPRELLREARRYRHLERRALVTWVGILYLPILMLSVVVLSSVGVQPPVAFAIAGVVFVGVFAFVLKARYR